MNKNLIIGVVLALVLAGGVYYVMTKEDSVAQADYVGMTPAEAEAKAQTEGVMFRVVEIDGVEQPTTRDYQEGRINATVEDGVVTEYFVESKTSSQNESAESAPAQTDVIIGKTVPEAEAYAQNEDVLFRVVEIDGVEQPTTRDFQEGRISATVEDGVVTDYSVETIISDPEENNEAGSSTHDAIIGMTVPEAETYAKAKGVDFRVGTIDGEGMPVTLDFRPGRITAETKGGVVIDYTVE